MVPRKAHYGRRNSAIVLISLVDIFVALTLFMFFFAWFPGLIKPVWVTAFIVIVAVSFVLNHKLFSDREKLKEVLNNYGPYSAKHRLYGAATVLAAFILFLSTSLLVDRYISAHS